MSGEYGIETTTGTGVNYCPLEEMKCLGI